MVDFAADWNLTRLVENIRASIPLAGEQSQLAGVRVADCPRCRGCSSAANTPTIHGFPLPVKMFNSVRRRVSSALQFPGSLT